MDVNLTECAQARRAPCRSLTKGAVDGLTRGCRCRSSRPRHRRQPRRRSDRAGAEPRPLEAALKELRHLSRERSRRTIGSRGYAGTQKKITRLQRRVANIRSHHLHVLTTRLAKTHSSIVAEGLDGAGMLRQKGLTGARARRRGLAEPADACRRSDGLNTGPAPGAGPGTSETITLPSTSRATSQPPRVIAPSAQLGPPSSVEPTIRPGPARQVAMKRGRDAATRLPSNPDTGCRRDEH